MDAMMIDVQLEQYLLTHTFEQDASDIYIYNSFSNSFGHTAFGLDLIEDILEEIRCFRMFKQYTMD